MSDKKLLVLTTEDGAALLSLARMPVTELRTIGGAMETIVRLLGDGDVVNAEVKPVLKKEKPATKKPATKRRSKRSRVSKRVAFPAGTVVKIGKPPRNKKSSRYQRWLTVKKFLDDQPSGTAPRSEIQQHVLTALPRSSASAQVSLMLRDRHLRRATQLNGMAH